MEYEWGSYCDIVDCIRMTWWVPAAVPEMMKLKVINFMFTDVYDNDDVDDVDDDDDDDGASDSFSLSQTVVLALI